MKCEFGKGIAPMTFSHTHNILIKIPYTMENQSANQTIYGATGSIGENKIKIKLKWSKSSTTCSFTILLRKWVNAMASFAINIAKPNCISRKYYLI